MTPKNSDELPARQPLRRMKLDPIKGLNTRIERAAKDWINWFAVRKNRAQTSSPSFLTTARRLESVSEQPASTDRPLDQSPAETAMAPINV